LETLYSYGIIGKAGAYLSFARWATEAFYILSVRPYQEVYNIDAGLQYWDYTLTDYGLCFIVLAALGVGFRLLALIALYVFDRDKRK
jgi:hypothetical protein